MRKFKILFIIPLCILSSCNQDDINQKENYKLGANIILNTTSLSVFDINQTMETSIITADGVSVTKMEVSSGTKSAEATISGDKATFNSSLLGTLIGHEDDGVSFSINSTLSNNKPYKKDFTVKITKALSLAKSLDAIVYNSSIKDSLTLKSITKSAVIDNITLEWKKGKAGTYASTKPLGKDLNAKGDNIPFVNFTKSTYNYNLKVKDTLYYRFIATSGILKDTLETSIPVISQMFNNLNKAVLSSDLTKNKLNLDTQTVYSNSNTDKGEIKFKSPAGFEKEGNTNIDFVKVGDLSSEESYCNTVDKLFAEKDLLVAKKLYDAGTKATGFSTTSKGELYIYKITRIVKKDGEPDKNVTKYGMIKIGNLKTITTVTNGNSVNSTEIAIEFGEAELHIQ